MTVTLASLRAAHPEFTDTPDAVLTPAIALAELEQDPDVWGDLHDYGVLLLAAHHAALSPYGQASKLVDVDGRSVYQSSWERLLLQVTAQARFT